jgi:hypothetical protein
MTKGPASSEISMRSIFSGMGSATSQSKEGNGQFNNSRATLLEEELEKEKADHQKTKAALDLSNERLQGAMADILDLRGQVEKLQIANKRTSQEYLGLTHDLIHERIIQEANLTRQRPMPQRVPSNLLHNTEVKDLDHTKSSRNVGLRPLSIIHATTISETTAAQGRSLPSSHNVTIPRIRFPVATGSDNRFGSASANSKTSTIQNSSPVPSAGVFAGLAPASHTGQSRPVSAGSYMAQNVNTAVKKGFQGWRHKLSNQFTNKHDREEKFNITHSNITQSNISQVPSTLKSLPALSPSVLLSREMSHILIDGAKRLTDDSGYASLELERFSGGPPADSR